MVSHEIVVKDMGEGDRYYVGTCGHLYESEEIDHCSKIRNEWFEKMSDRGLRIKVAFLDGERVGFIYLMPIEISPWGPLGEDLMFMPCLVSEEEGKGVGKALIDSAEEIAREQEKKGILTRAYFPDFFFMPGEFFERCGFEVLKSRELEDEGLTEALMCRVFDPPIEEVDFLKSDHEFEAVEGKVVIDLFWNTFCQTSVIEANRVRKVIEEFGDKVVLREHRIEDRDDLLEYGIYRGIYVDGEQISWGHEAPEEGIREAVERAVNSI